MLMSLLKRLSLISVFTRRGTGEYNNTFKKSIKNKNDDGLLFFCQTKLTAGYDDSDTRRGIKRVT